MPMQKFHGDPLALTDLEADVISHIALKNERKCQQECTNKPCTYICPSEVYNWNFNANKVAIDYKRCIECGACVLACPQENIIWVYPRAGYGVTYHHG